jgi:hypothetical protein
VRATCRMDLGTEQPATSSRRPWMIAFVVVVVVVAFIVGVWFPRSWLPGNLATHLPSSCSTTIARTHEIVSHPHPSAADRSELRDMVNDRPDCFSKADKDALD